MNEPDPTAQCPLSCCLSKVAAWIRDSLKMLCNEASKSHKIYVQKQIQCNYKLKYQVTDNFPFYCWIKQGSLFLLKQTVDIVQLSIILYLCETKTTSLFYNVKQEGNAFYLRGLANLFYTSRTYNNSDYKCFNAVVSMYVTWALTLNCSNCFTLFNMSNPTSLCGGTADECLKYQCWEISTFALSAAQRGIR